MNSERPVERIGRRFRVAFLRPPHRQTNESDIDALERIHMEVKEKKAVVRNLMEQYRKYSAKIQESIRLTKEFEIALFCSFDTDESNRDNTEDALNNFPDIIEQNQDNRLETIRARIEEASKSVKSAEALKSDYLAYKNMYEKANNQKKDIDKWKFDESKKKLSERVQELVRNVPQLLTSIDDDLYRWAADYLDKKCTYLETSLSKTRSTKDEVRKQRDARSRHYNKLSNYLSSQSNNEYLIPNEEMTPLNEHRNSRSNDSALAHKASSGSDRTTDLSSLKPPFDVIALYSYKPNEEDELSFEAGDAFTVLPYENTEEQEEGWLYGEHHKNKRKGLFPVNYVKPV